MEILNKLIRFEMAAVMAILFSLPGFSQEYVKLQAAFEESYTKESSGEYSNAIEILRAVYDEDSYEINFRLGWLSYSTGNFTESMAYYQKAAALKPFAIEPRFGLTLPASAVGNWEMVRQQYITILEIDPMNTKANYYLGLIYYNRENYEEAEKCLEKVVNLYPFDYDGMILFAWTNYKMGKLREAKVLFNKVLLNNPGDESATEGLKLIQ